MKFKSHNSVPAVKYPIRLFDDLNWKFIEPFEVTTECDRLLGNRSNKTVLKPYGILLESQLL